MKQLIILIIALFCIWALLSVLGPQGRLALNSVFLIAMVIIILYSDSLFSKIICCFLAFTFLCHILQILQSLGKIHTQIKFFN